MTAIMATMTAITETVRGHTEAVPLNIIIGQPTLNYVQQLVEMLATFESRLKQPNGVARMVSSCSSSEITNCNSLMRTTTSPASGSSSLIS